ncbi:hypothetical protein ACFQY0_06305 [Haloferula chungangensis]|uniref:Phage holin n=1 Tax=Haloferula chungangensis TaxID=1048331 RepID=A0ABW2L359_9BACT
MRPLIFTAGSLISALGFVADARISDPALFQGALTLGGGYIICGLVSRIPDWKWHGIITAGVLSLLAAARCAPALLELPNKTNAAPYQALAFLITSIVLIAVIRTLKAERARRQMEEFEKMDS